MNGPFAPEIVAWNKGAELVSFTEDMMAEADWVGSPSNGFKFLADISEYGREAGLFHFDQPAFMYVEERLRMRSAELVGTGENEMKSMKMKTWLNREPPLPGDPQENVLQVFDWFLPLLRRLGSKMDLYYGNTDRTASGHEFTLGEAVDCILDIADWCSKDSHFQHKTVYGWWDDFEWVSQVRKEILDWRNKLKARTVGDLPPASSVPFSVG
jgi:hypothetical protein